MPTVTCTTQTEVKISPSVQKRLRTELTTYSALRTELKSIEAKMDASKAKIEAVREETGEQKLEIDGYSVCIVAPIRNKFSAKKFVSLGGDLAIYNQAVESVTSKPYTKISCPGSKSDDE
jgi:hypothetical protein